MKLIDYWRCSKEIIRYLPYFSPDATIDTLCVTPTIFQDNNIKVILDVNRPQAFKDICKRNQYNMVKYSIINAPDCLQNMESSYSTTTPHSSRSISSGGNSMKCKGKGKAQGNLGRKGKCSHCSKWHYTKDGDFSGTLRNDNLS